MAEKQQMRAPAGIAGLVRYDEEEDSLIKLKPVHIFIVAIGMIVLEAILLIAFPV